MNIPNPIDILGVKVHPIKLFAVLKIILQTRTTRRRLLLFPVNIHILMELKRHSDFVGLYNKADIVFADGVPVVWLSRFFGTPLPERVSGTDLVHNILIQEKHVFLLGSGTEVLEHMKNKYPSICGIYSPPFRAVWGKIENSNIIRAIQKSRARILLVGVGPLKQERWLLKDFQKTGCLIGVAVGSAFDILSGKTPRAPVWLQSCGLEWFWRVLYEPKRLAFRYISDFFSLIWFLLGCVVSRLFRGYQINII